jgi:hypothetical protein
MDTLLENNLINLYLPGQAHHTTYIDTDEFFDCEELCDNPSTPVATASPSALSATTHNNEKCMARTWKDDNGGTCGKQCTSKKKGGGDFCGTHGRKYDKPCCKGKPGCGKIHTFAWEHLGRCDERAPGWWLDPNRTGGPCRC